MKILTKNPFNLSYFTDQSGIYHSKMAKLILSVTIHIVVLYAAGLLGAPRPTTPEPTRAPTLPPVPTEAPYAGPDWPTAIREALEHRDSYLESIRTIKDAHTTENIRASVLLLQPVPSMLVDFHKTNFKEVKPHDDPAARNLFRKIDQIFTKIQVRDLYRSPAFENDYRRTGLGFVLAKFKNIFDMGCLYKLISPPATPRDIEIPLQKICAGLTVPNTDYAPIDDICTDFDTCVPSDSGDDACASDNKCDLIKALPKFAALIWYKISNYLAQVICGTFNDKEEDRTLAYENIQRDVRHVMSYMMNTEWDDFFRNAVQSGGFTTLPRLMELVGERKDYMRFEEEFFLLLVLAVIVVVLVVVFVVAVVVFCYYCTCFCYVSTLPMTRINLSSISAMLPWHVMN